MIACKPCRKLLLCTMLMGPLNAIKPIGVWWSICRHIDTAGLPIRVQLPEHAAVCRHAGTHLPCPKITPSGLMPSARPRHCLQTGLL